jgi:hypothetical protein
LRREMPCPIPLLLMLFLPRMAYLLTSRLLEKHCGTN